MLVRDDGSTIYDSVVIVEYIEGLVGEPRLIPAAFEDRIQVKRWEALGDGIRMRRLPSHMICANLRRSASLKRGT